CASFYPSQAMDYW
nr:immunoglobulin heavy chain junction region [Mus musculus]